MNRVFGNTEPFSPAVANAPPSFPGARLTGLEPAEVAFKSRGFFHLKKDIDRRDESPASRSSLGKSAGVRTTLSHRKV